MSIQRGLTKSCKLPAHYTFRILGKAEDEKVYVHSFRQARPETEGWRQRRSHRHLSQGEEGRTMTFKNELNANVDKKDKATEKNGVKVVGK